MARPFPVGDKNLPGSQKSSRKFTANPNPWAE
jgi:hypothetical protein